MKIIYPFLLAVGYASVPLLAGGQTLPPSGQFVPSARQPVPALWQPLPGNNRVIPGNAFIFKQSSTSTRLNTGFPSAPGVLDPMTGFPRHPFVRVPPASANSFRISRTFARLLPAELPGLNYEDLRGKDGHLHAPLPPGPIR